MIIKKIILENIRSYQYQEIIFPEGSILLSGDIGCGKTTILLGIEFALFGLQPGQKGSSLLKNGAEKGKVIIEFEIDGGEIVVERELKRGKTVSQDSCSITIGGNKKETSVIELKNKILELLNYPKEFSKKQNLLYKFTVYTPQEEMKQIILQDSETRTNTLRHVFGIDKYKRILENTSILTAKLREEKRIKEGIIANLEYEKQELTKKENDLKTKEINLSSFENEFILKTSIRKEIQKEKEEVSKKIEEKNKLKQEVEKTKLVISNKKDTILNNGKLSDRIRLQIFELNKLSFSEGDILKIEQEITLIRKEKERLNEKSIELSSQLAFLNSRNEENKKIEKKFSTLEICPTCLQNVDSVYRANAINTAHSEIAETNKKIEIFEKERKEILEHMRKLDLDVHSKEKSLTDLKILRVRLQEVKEKQIHLEEIEKSNISLKKDIELLEQHVEILKNSVFDLGKFDSIFESKQGELEESLRNERVAEIKFAELKREIEVFSRQIEELRKKIRNSELIQNQLMYISELESWLSKSFMNVISSIEKNVMLSLKAKFSQLFSEWFAMLVSDSFNVKLSDDFTPIIEHQDYEIDYEYLSGGERTAVALAYRLSLNQVINSLLSKIKTKDFVILDEPTDGFSDQQLDKMRDVLQELDVKQLIIVSHEQKIESFVENVLKFKKVNGISGIDI